MATRSLYGDVILYFVNYITGARTTGNTLANRGYFYIIRIVLTLSAYLDRRNKQQSIGTFIYVTETPRN